MNNKREHNGYLQIQNEYPKADGKIKKVWEYVINGFTDNDSMAQVALFSGGEVGHPIDNKGRLTVRTGVNRYHKTKHWYH